MDNTGINKDIFLNYDLNYSFFPKYINLVPEKAIKIDYKMLEGDNN